MIPGTGLAVSQMLSAGLLVFAVVADVVIRSRIKAGKMTALSIETAVVDDVEEEK